MRILYVNDSLAIWGGLERVLIDKMNYLAEEYGYEVHVVTADQNCHSIPYPLSPKVVFCDLGICFYQEFKYKGLERLRVKWKLRKLYINRLREYVCQVQPDLIYCVRLFLLGPVLKVRGEIPLIVESHSSCRSYQYEVDGMFKRLREVYYVHQVRKAQMVVALTEGDATDWRRYNKHVIVIPNFVHLNETGNYSDCLSKSAIFVGRFSKQKDIGMLLKIWSVVHQKYPEWKLHIYGGYGDQYKQLMTIVPHVVSDNIFVHDSTPNIFDEYLKNSMLLLTSLYEPFGLVIPEAMSCGLPVVAFDCPYGPASIISDGVDGFLVKNRDVSSYCNAVFNLISNDSIRQEVGKAGVISSQRYKISNIMPLWKSLFESCVNMNNKVE